MKLSEQKCIPCEGGFPPLTDAEAREQLKQLSGWTLEGVTIKKQYTFKTFPEAVAFVNKIAVIAEKEGHHPDLFISYNKVTATLTTHAIKGLSVNDFIIADKMDEFYLVC